MQLVKLYWIWILYINSVDLKKIWNISILISTVFLLKWNISTDICSFHTASCSIRLMYTERGFPDSHRCEKIYTVWYVFLYCMRSMELHRILRYFIQHINVNPNGGQNYIIWPSSCNEGLWIRLLYMPGVFPMHTVNKLCYCSVKRALLGQTMIQRVQLFWGRGGGGGADNEYSNNKSIVMSRYYTILCYSSCLITNKLTKEINIFSVYGSYIV